tara:strand:- start:2032 stop:2655 length:624 start_codon:yes stop_codon:yes gene_type:complete
MRENYCIKKGYVSRDEEISCPQMGRTDKFQDEVYLFAKKLYTSSEYSTVADIGCGSAYKLIKYFGDESYTGFEIEPNLSYLRETYPHGDFRQSNFSNPPTDSFDLVICSDVVEHLLRPDELMDFIGSINYKHLVMSTPDRDIIQEIQRNMGWEVSQDGPPHNLMHIREWNSNEFMIYMSDHVDIEAHLMAPIQSECQILIGRPLSKT